MSNHVATITKDEGRCSFSRKALSVFMAVLLAFLMMPMVPAESAFAAVDDAIFADSAVEYTQDVVDGDIVVEWNGANAAVGVNSIIAKKATKAYTGGATFDEKGVEYIVRYFVDHDRDGKFEADDVRADAEVGSDQWGMTAPSHVGEYFVVAMTENAAAKLPAASAEAGSFVDEVGIIVQHFEIAARSLEGVQAVNVVDEDNGVFTESFTYNTQEQKVGFALDGKLLEEGVDYSVTIVEKATGGKGPVVNAGEYEATVVGMGGYQNDELKIPFTVNQLDLSKAVIYVEDVQAGGSLPSHPITTVNGVSLAEFIEAEHGTGDLQFAQTKYQGTDGKTYASSEVGEGYKVWGNQPAAGGYYFDLKPVSTSKNVVQNVSAEYKINAVTELVTDFEYDGEAFAQLNGAVFDLSKGKGVTSDGTTELDGYASSYVTVGDYKADQFTVTPETAGEPGAYTAIARMVVPADYSFGGSAKADFSVVAGVLDPESVDVVVTFNGINFDFTAGDKTYDDAVYTGQPVIPAISVEADGKALVAGEDYTVSYANDANGDAVESMVNAGKYKVSVTLASGYVFEDGTTDGKTVAEFYVEIAKRELTSIEIVLPKGAEGLLYTGSAIEPGFVGYHEYALDAEKSVEVALDPSWYTVSGILWEDVAAEAMVPAEQVLKVGSYELMLTPTMECKNYTWDSNVVKVEFEVVENAYFDDVASDAWYADEVAKAKALEYVDGMGNNLFFPEAEMTRAQFAQVLYNMANEPEAGVEPGTYPTQFSDVESTAWYAKAVSWAVEAGVVNGVSDTEFEPEGKITREQIATMLYRYASNGAEADLSVLDQFADAESVSDWAETAMAWAVEEGHMNGRGGDGLQPQGNATRAEVAALSVRVQPERYNDHV